MQLELKRIQREVGITFVFVTHDQGEALTMSDRIAVMSQGRVEQIGTPEEIYHSPASLFVAGFIGSANLLPGEVTATDGEDAVVELKAGGSIRTRTGSATHVGDPVSVMLRPERLSAATEPAADGRSIDGHRRELIFQGIDGPARGRARRRHHRRRPDGDRQRGPLRPPRRHVRGQMEPGAAYLIAGWPSVAGATSTDVDDIEAAL
jgi:ABC-type Fe3+/spermidine/putrescine transport system ATPase subunit